MGDTEKSFNNLQLCFTGSSLIQLIPLIKLIGYQIGKTRLAFSLPSNYLITGKASNE